MKSPGPAVAEDLFGAIAGFEYLDFAGQDHRHAKFALAGFENHLATPQQPSGAQRLQQRELTVVEFGKGDGFRIAVKLSVLVLVVHETTGEN